MKQEPWECCDTGKGNILLCRQCGAKAVYSLETTDLKKTNYEWSPIANETKWTRENKYTKVKYKLCSYINANDAYSI